jgi:hypothetical protein
MIAFLSSFPTVILRVVSSSNLLFKTLTRFPIENYFLNSFAFNRTSSFNASYLGNISIESPSIPTIVRCIFINSSSHTST